MKRSTVRKLDLSFVWVTWGAIMISWAFPQDVKLNIGITALSIFYIWSVVRILNIDVSPHQTGFDSRV
jgi:hypothetical protein